jgi:transcriptional regulator with XRE-family HTH domain
MKDYTNNEPGLYLAENIRALRKRFNWSQEELADKIGMNRGNIASYENGTAEPKICNLVKLSRLFNVSIFDLTHENLKEEETYTLATRSHQNGQSIWHSPLIARFINEADDIQNAVKGLQCLFRLKMNNLKDNAATVQFLNDQFDQLHGLTEHLLRSHLELIALIQEKCKEHSEEKA